MKPRAGLAVVLLMVAGLRLGHANGDDDDLQKLKTRTRVATEKKDEKNRLEESGVKSGPDHEKVVKEYEKSRDEIAQIADQKPASPKLQKEAGKALLGLDETDRALPIIDRAVDLAPNDPEARLIRGNVHYKLGDYEKAVDDAKKVLEMNPKNRGALALLQLSQGRTSASGPRAAPPPSSGARAGAAGPPPAARQVVDDSQAQAAAGRIRVGKLLGEAAGKMSLGDAASAKALLDKAVAADPKNAEARAKRAKARHVLKDFSGALEDSEGAIRLDPKAADAYQVRGLAREALGQSLKEVIGDYEAAARLDAGRFEEFYGEAVARLKAEGGGASGTAVTKDESAGEKKGTAPRGGWLQDMWSGRLAQPGKKRGFAVVAGLGVLLAAGIGWWLWSRAGDSQ